MSGCSECSAREVFVDDASAFVATAPARPMCRPCVLEAA